MQAIDSAGCAARTIRPERRARRTVFLRRDLRLRADDFANQTYPAAWIPWSALASPHPPIMYSMTPKQRWCNFRPDRQKP